jgi:hypothetical protein
MMMDITSILFFTGVAYELVTLRLAYEYNIAKMQPQKVAVKTYKYRFRPLFHN